MTETKTKTIELTFCGASLFASGPFCATGGLEDDLGGGGENACAAAATRPTFNVCAWSLLPAAVVEFPDPLGLLLAWFIPAPSRRDAAAGFFVIARWAAVATAAPELPAAAVEFPDPLGLLLAWFIPAASRRDAAAGFFVIARWAAPAMAADA
jgi:hypothetical protein